ncbi:hypothetical protein V6N11_055926 [Hibiscus sabdariffa]|uniref:Uncharacterized protein n=1 Tax=Hibiscus sabdariffa TaxID=183260 RepID=A0ABR2T2D3_9ROSI
MVSLTVALKDITLDSVESSFCPTEDEDDVDDEEREIELGPKCTLREQLEKDKDDESLRSRKEQLLGTVDFNFVEV